MRKVSFFTTLFQSYLFDDVSHAWRLSF